MGAAARRAPSSDISAPLALTMGDPAGIAPDVTLAAWHALRGSDDVFVLIGDADVLRQRAELLGSPTPLATISYLSEAPSVFDKALPVCPFLALRQSWPANRIREMRPPLSPPSNGPSRP